MLVEQVYTFVWSIATGAIIGILFDLLRSFRFSGIKDIWVYIQDIIFWIVTAVIIIASAFLINEGEIRGYMLIGYLLGAGFYMLLLSKFVLYIFKLIFGSIRKIFDKLKNKIMKALKNINKNKKNVEAKQEI